MAHSHFGGHEIMQTRQNQHDSCFGRMIGEVMQRSWIGMPELGTVKLSDLAAIVGPRQQPVMRDRYFQPLRRLSEYLRLAEDNGSITD